MSQKSFNIITNQIKKEDLNSAIALLDNFNDLSNRELRIIIEIIIQKGEGILIIDNIKKFKGIEVREVFYTLIQLHDLKTIIAKFDFFKNYININDLLIELIKSGEKESVLKYITKFKISKDVLLEISKNDDYFLNDFINEISLLSEDEDARYTKEKIIIDEFIKHKELDFSRFDKIKYYSKKEIAFKLVNNNLGSVIVKNIKQFDEDDTLEIIFYLINFGKSWLVLEYLINSNKNQEKIIYEIIRAGYSHVFTQFEYGDGSDAYESTYFLHDVLETFKENIVIESIKQGYGAHGFLTTTKTSEIDDYGYKYEKDLDTSMVFIGGCTFLENKFEKIILKNNLGDVHDYYRWDGYLESSINLAYFKESNLDLIKEFKDEEVFCEEIYKLFLGSLRGAENLIYFYCLFQLRNYEYIHRNGVSGKIFSSFLVSYITQIFQNGINIYNIDHIINNLEILNEIEIYECFSLKNKDFNYIFNTDYFKKQLAFQLIDSGGVEKIINNIEKFKHCYDDIIMLLKMNNFSYLFNNFEKIKNIDEKNIIAKKISDILLIEKSWDILSYYFNEFGCYHEKEIPLEILKEGQKSRYEEDKYKNEEENYKNNLDLLTYWDDYDEDGNWIG